MVLVFTKQQNFKPVQIEAFPDDRKNVRQDMKFDSGKEENNEGTGENCGECNTILSAYTKYMHLG